MINETYRTDISTDTATELASVARTSLGDTLRSIIYFTPSSFDVIYLRQGLYDSPDAARPDKKQLVELERVGFAEIPVRTTTAERGDGLSIGPYEFTVRFHDDGFVIRVLQDDAGVILTADSMDVNAFEDAAIAIRRLLSSE